MKISRRYFTLHLAALLVCFTVDTQAQNDAIVVRGSSKFEIGVGTFAGLSASEIKIQLSTLLRDSGYFKIVAPRPGVYTVQGRGTGGQIDSSLIGPQGQSIFNRDYRRSNLGNNVQILADDIIEAITGTPGITSGKIVFTGRKAGRKELFLCNYDGSGVRQLTRDSSIAVAPSISPDGSFVAYTSYVSGYPDIHTINTNTGARSRIVNAPGTNGGAAISPDGRNIACTMSFSGNKELYVVSRNGGRPRSLTRTRGSESSPTWSPSGSEIIYCSDQTGSPQLYRIGSNGGQAKLLGLGQGYCTEPAWSPDGNYLAYSARLDTGMTVMLHHFRSNTSTALRAGEAPAWAADSRHLIYVSNGALYRLNVDSDKLVRLATGIAGISEPSWSR
jgi:TolB protein